MNDDKLLQVLKLSLRVDGDEDDEILNRNISAAKSYVIGAIGYDDGIMTGFYELSDIKDQFEMVVIAIASSYYTYRSAIVGNAVSEVDLVSYSIIGQLRGKYIDLEQRGGVNGSKN